VNQLTNIGTNGVSGFIEDLTLVRIPPWWQSPWFIALMLLGLAVLGFVGFQLYVRWHGAGAKRVLEQTADEEPPHLWALRELEDLRRRMGELGPYRFTIECSLVRRRYIEARFKLPIIYQTTREFLGHAQTHTALNEEDRSTLADFLRLCDLVKFARRSASPDELTRMVDDAVAFVKACAKEPTPATAASEKASPTA
jgi:hypothetical protein